MRRLGFLAAAALVASFVAVPIAQAAPSSAFSGSWVSIDPVDGSTQHLYIQGGATVQVLYVDAYGTVCGLVGAPTNVFTAILTGTVSGNELDAWFKAASCGPRIILSGASFFFWTFLYDPDTDTLWGAVNDGPTTWYRT